MTREEILACLTDRPCTVCKYHSENGCGKWNCVFEEEPEDKPVNVVLDDMKSIFDRMIADGWTIVEKRRKENAECT